MKSLLSLILAAGLCAVAGCGSGGTKSKLDPGALEAAFKDTPPEVKAESPPPGDESTTDTLVISGNQAEVPIKELATRAATAMRKDDLVEATILLQNLRRAKNMSADQLTAVQDQMSAFQLDLVNKAEAGDAKAKQALALLQKSTRW